MPLDLVSIGFGIDTAGLKTANDTMDAVLTKAGKLDTVLTNLGKNKPKSKVVEEANEEVKAIDKTIVALENKSRKVKETASVEEAAADKATKALQRRADQNEAITRGFTVGEASQIAGFKAISGATQEYIRVFEQAITKTRELSGGKNPFDSSVGSVRKVNDELKALTLQAQFLSKGYAISSKELSGMLDVQTRLTAAGKLSTVEINAAVEGYRQAFAFNEKIVGSNRSITAAKEAENKVAQANLNIIEKTLAQTELLNKIKPLKAEGFTTSQAKDIVNKQGSGVVSAEQINAYKAALLALNPAVDSSTKEFAKLEAEAYKMNAAIDKGIISLQELKSRAATSAKLVTEGFSTSQASSIARLDSKGVPSTDLRAFYESKNAEAVATKELAAAESLAVTEANRLSAAQQRLEDNIRKTTIALELQKQGYSRASANAGAAAIIKGGDNAEVAQLLAARKATDDYATAQKEAAASTNFFHGILRTATGTLAAIGVSELSSKFYELSKYILKTADEMRNLEARLKLVSNPTEDLTALSEKLLGVANRTRQPIAELGNLYTRLKPALASTGRSTQDVLNITEAFGKTLLISGTNAREAASAILQFSQAMQSGKLAGDEFRSVSEADPALLKAIAQGAGVARDALKQMSSAGLLTTKVVSDALLKQKESLDLIANGIPPTLSQNVVLVENSFSVLINTLNKGLGVTQGLTDIFGRMIERIDGIGKSSKESTGALNAIGSAFGFVFKNVDSLILGYAAYKVALFALLEIQKVGLAVMALWRVAAVLATSETLALAAGTGFLATAEIFTTAAVEGLIVALGGLKVALLSTGIGAIAIGLGALAVYFYNSADAAKEAAKGKQELAKADAALARQMELSKTSLAYEKSSYGELLELYPKMAAEKLKAARSGIDAKDAQKEILALTEDQQKEYEALKNNAQKVLDLKVKEKSSSEEIKKAQEGIAVSLREVLDGYHLATAAAEGFKEAGVDKGAIDSLRKQADKLQLIADLRDGINGKPLKKFEAEAIANVLTNKTSKEVNTKDPAISALLFQAGRGQDAEDRIKAQDERDRKAKEAAKGKIAIDPNPYTRQIKDLESVIPLLGRINNLEVLKLAQEAKYVVKYGESLEIAKKIAGYQKQADDGKLLITTKNSLELEKEKYNIVKAGGNALLADLDAQAALYESSNKMLGITKEQYAVEKEKLALQADTAYLQQNTALKEQLKLLSQGYTTQQAITLERAIQVNLANGMNLADAISDAKAKLGIQEALTESVRLEAAASDKIAATRKQIADSTDEAKRNPLAAISKIDFAPVLGTLANPFKEVLAGLSDVVEKQKEFNVLRTQAAGDTQKLKILDTEQAASNIANGAKILGATKNFFDQKSKGYKILGEAEKAFRVLELFENLKAFAFKSGLLTAEVGLKVGADAAKGVSEVTFTGFSVAQSAIRTAASAVEAAVSSMAGLPFPINLVALGATVAAIASLGVSLTGGGGGGGSPIVDAGNEGKGTVLGDKNAQSDSLKKGIDILAKNSDLTLVYSNRMLRALNNIESSIGNVSTLLVKQQLATGKTAGGALAASVNQSTQGSSLTESVTTGLNVASALKVAASVVALTSAGGAIAGVAAGIGGLLGLLGPIGIIAALAATFIPAVGKLIGRVVGSLFGTTKQTVTGTGLALNNQSLGDIANGGSANLQQYADISTTKKSIFKKSTSLSTLYAAADEETTKQITQIFRGIYTAVKSAGEGLGRPTAELTDRLNAFVINLGKIKLDGLNPQQVQDKLNAVFSAASDSIAQAAIPGLEDFQQVGEGYFTTVTRVATAVEQARSLTNRLRINVIDYNSVINKQGDITTEILRQSITQYEKATFGFVTGVSDIVDTFNGAAPDLFALYQDLGLLRNGLSSTGKSVADLSIEMIQGAGSLDALKNGFASYFSDFLTKEQQATELQKQLNLQFAQLNLVTPRTKEEFIKLVGSIDTTTAAGKTLYGAVIALAPSFNTLDSALQQVGLVSNPKLLKSYGDLEAKFKTFGIVMPTTTAAFDALVEKLQAGGGNVIQLSDAFSILTTANTNLRNINLEVASKTSGLSDKFAALGLQLPTTRIGFDALILSLQTSSGSSTTSSLAVSALSNEFNALSIASKDSGAATAAVNAATTALSTTNTGYANANTALGDKVRALSSDFYDFQIQLASFGGEAGKAIQTVFASLFNARNAVSGDIARITGTDKTLLSPSQIKAGISTTALALPSLSGLTTAASTRLTALSEQSRLSGLVSSGTANVTAAQGGLANVNSSIVLDKAISDALKTRISSAVNGLSATQYGVYDGDRRTGYAADASGNRANLGLNADGTSFGNVSSVQFRGYQGAASNSAYATQQLNNTKDASGLNQAQIANGALNSKLVDALKVYNDAVTAASQAQAGLNSTTATLAQNQAALLVANKAVSDADANVLKQQDIVRTALNGYALDADKNIKRLDKLRTETVRYYDAQKALSDLMTSSADKLATTIKGIRDAALTPVQRLNELQTEFQTAYGKAQVATGATLVTAADQLNALIQPLLTQAATVYASGSEADNIKNFALSAGDAIVKRLNDLNPKDYQTQSVDLLNQIDSALYSLEESSVQANKLLIAAIDLARVQTVAELVQIAKAVGGTPANLASLTASANGNAFSGGMVTAYANGGAFTNSVVSKPTLAPMALFGEAGAEAIMPLGRNSSGQLGVHVISGGGDNSQIVSKLEENNLHAAALVRVQQSANKQIIDRLTQVEDKLSGLESAARLSAVA